MGSLLLFLLFFNHCYCLIRKSVYCTAARTGGKREFDYFMKKFRQAERSEEKTLYLSVLSSFTNTCLIQEVLGRDR